MVHGKKKNGEDEGGVIHHPRLDWILTLFISKLAFSIVTERTMVLRRLEADDESDEKPVYARKQDMFY